MSDRMQAKPPKTAAEAREEVRANLRSLGVEHVGRRAGSLASTVENATATALVAMAELYGIAESGVLPRFSIDGEALAQKFEHLARCARAFPVRE